MPLTEPQTRLSGTLDRHVKYVHAQGRGDEALLERLAEAWPMVAFACLREHQRFNAHQHILCSYGG